MGLARLRNAVKQLQTEIAHYHVPIMGSGMSKLSHTKPPDEEVYGDVVFRVFTVDTDETYRTARINDCAVPGSIQMHVHWTKSQTTNQQNKNVCWRIDYSQFDGATDPIVSGSYILLSGSYLDSGTSERYIYKTPDVTLNVSPSMYVAFKAMTVSCSNPISEPAGLSADLVWDEYINVDITGHVH